MSKSDTNDRAGASGSNLAIIPVLGWLIWPARGCPSSWLARSAPSSRCSPNACTRACWPPLSRSGSRCSTSCCSPRSAR